MIATFAVVAATLAAVPVTVDSVGEDRAGVRVAMVEAHTPTTPFPYFAVLGEELEEGQRITLAKAHALAVTLEDRRRGP